MAEEKEVREQNEHFKAELKKEFAFESGGVKYYQFAEGGMPIYYSRLVAMQEKVNMAKEWKVTATVMDEFLGILEVLGGVRSGDQRVQELTAEQRLQEMNGRVSMMRKRIEMGGEMSLLYDLASVWFFDETEDPAKYDYAYAKVKIARWLNDHALHAFFLRTPLSDFLELQTSYNAGTAIYLQNLYELLYTASIHNFSMLSEKEKESELGQNILLHAQKYLALKNLAGFESPSTTIT